MDETTKSDPRKARQCARLHIRLGWWLLLVFLTLGVVLEALHGFKSDWYLNLDHETRRMMWRLAHAHGTLLALVHLGFGVYAHHYFDRARGRFWQFASPLLTAASLLLPAGFLIGGIVLYEGSPGPGILLVPVGATLLVVAVLLTALSGTRAHARP